MFQSSLDAVVFGVIVTFVTGTITALIASANLKNMKNKA